MLAYAAFHAVEKLGTAWNHMKLKARFMINMYTSISVSDNVSGEQV